MTEAIYQNLKYHGQKVVSSILTEEQLVISLFNDIDNLIDNGHLLKKEIINNIKSFKNIPFPISNHEIFYCSNLDTPQEKLNYLNHRYKFYKANKFHEEYESPPYLLLEPVSACNLRCPMCFQIDKTFTRKPFMGIMKWDLFTRLIDEAEELSVGSITLASRGEPTMHPKYSEMLKYISNNRLDVWEWERCLMKENSDWNISNINDINNPLVKKLINFLHADKDRAILSPK